MASARHRWSVRRHSTTRNLIQSAKESWATEIERPRFTEAARTHCGWQVHKACEGLRRGNREAA